MKKLVFVLLALVLMGCNQETSPQREEQGDRVSIGIGLHGDSHEGRHGNHGRGHGDSGISGSVNIESR
jgi:hypothetical protein